MVINPSVIPQLSLMILVTGARQFVVHEAFETTFKSAVYLVWLTPMTNIGTSSFGGAEMITFFAPPARCADAFSFLVKTPVLSQTYSTPELFHPIFVGSVS